MAAVFPPISGGSTIEASTDKIDGDAVDGLSGVADSLAYKVHELEKHVHNREYWYGKDSIDTFLCATSATGW